LDPLPRLDVIVAEVAGDMFLAAQPSDVVEEDGVDNVPAAVLDRRPIRPPPE